MQQSWAKVLADSITPAGHRLTTLETGLWRPNLSEQNTHRAISRNSASSRAVSIEKMLQRFFDESADNPIVWPSEQPGMQGGTQLTGEALEDAQELWWGLQTHVYATIQDYVTQHPDKAERLHKSLLNRWLEIGVWQVQILSATSWEGYEWQRCHPAAEPHIKVHAEQVRDAIGNSTPTHLTGGQWHLPLFGVNGGHKSDYDDARDVEKETRIPYIEVCKRVSSGRCARVSYLTHDGERDLIKDVELWSKLADRSENPEDPPHASPLEHVATPWLENCQDVVLPNGKVMRNLPKVGNFVGWVQMRHLELAF